MSLKNLLSANQNDLFCNSLTTNNLNLNLQQATKNNILYYDTSNQRVSFDDFEIASSGTLTTSGTVSGTIDYNLYKVGNVKILILRSATITKNAVAGQVITNGVNDFIPLNGEPSVLTNTVELTVGQAIYGLNVNQFGQVNIYKCNVGSNNIPANQTFTISQCQIVYV
jgi:hypothetical protein